MASTRKRRTGRARLAQPSTAGTSQSEFQISDKELKALAPKLAQLRQAVPRADARALREDAMARMPAQKVLDGAVAAGMTAYENERRRLKKLKMSRQQEEEMRERLDATLKQNFVRISIDEDLARYNLEQADYRLSVSGTRAYLVSPEGEVTLDIGDLRDARALDVATVILIAQTILEIAGLIASIAGLRVSPNHAEVQKVVQYQLAYNSKFLAAVKTFIDGFGKAANAFERAWKIVNLVSDLYGIANFWRDIATQVFAGMAWYQKAWAIASFVGTIAAMFITAAASLAYKIAVLVYQIISLVEKACKLAPQLQLGGVCGVFREIRVMQARQLVYA
jgi:hypothetical protein